MTRRFVGLTSNQEGNTMAKRMKRERFPGAPVGFTPRPGAGFGESWAPKVGDHIMGKVKSFKTSVGPNKQDVVILATTGGDVTVWLSSNLQGRLTKKDVGRSVYVQRTKDVPHRKKGYSPIKTFYVGVK